MLVKNVQCNSELQLPEIPKYEILHRIINHDLNAIYHGTLLAVNNLQDNKTLVFDFLELSSSINKFKKNIYLLPLPNYISKENLYEEATFIEDELKKFATSLNKVNDLEIKDFCQHALNFCKNLKDIMGFQTYHYNSIKCISMTGTPLSLNINAFLDLTGTRGIIFDVDDCLIKSEIFQKLSWFESISKLVNDENVAERMKDAVSDCFYTGNMKELIPSLYRICEEFGVPFRNEKELDLQLTQKRYDFLDYQCSIKNISLFKNIRELLTELYLKNIRIGIYTSNMKSIATMLLNNLLGKDFFDRVIPEEYRLFVDDPELKAKKPDPSGWLLASKRMNLPLNQISIVDDNILALKSTIYFGFASIVGLYHNPDNIQHWTELITRENFNNDTLFFLLENCGRLFG